MKVLKWLGWNESHKGIVLLIYSANFDTMIYVRYLFRYYMYRLTKLILLYYACIHCV